MQGTCCASAHTTDCCTDSAQKRTNQTDGNCVYVPASALPTTIVACCCCGNEETAENQTDAC